MRILVALVTSALLGGCQTTNKRCQEIRLEAAVGQLGGTPPKPSDEAWYAEHCFEGRSR